MNRFFDIFLRRPRIAVALALAALIAGALSVPSLSVAFFPTVSRPTISVSCTYPGANAREVMSTVAGPLEDQVNGVEGFDHMTSTCDDSGSYSLTVYFQTGFDKDLALMKVQAKVQQALTQLPQEVKNTGVTVGIGQTIDLGWVALYSDRGEMTRDEVTDYMYGVVDPAILRVQGVGASVVQDEKLAMRVWLDADRLAALGINTDEVVAAIKQQNVQASLGIVGGSPSSDPRSRVLSLVAKGRLKTPEEFGSIIVRSRPDGSFVYLRDIARIGLGHQTYNHVGSYCGKPACLTHLYQLPGANTFETVAKIKEILEELAPRFPGDLKWDLPVDVTRHSGSALRGIALALAFSAGIAFLVLLAFFRSVRQVLVAFLSALVPFSLVLTTLAAFGYFVTVLTLYALTAALVFMIVTAAYVMSSARAGRLAQTRIPLLAAGGALTVSMLVLMLVGGVQGIILRQFAVVLAATGVASTLNALTVVPAFANALGLVTSEPATVERPRFAGSLFVGLAVVVALGLAACALSTRVPRDLVPNEDFGVILVDFKTRNGTARPQVEKIVSESLKRMVEACEIEKYFSVLGEGIFSPAGENTAKAYLMLKPWDARANGESVQDVIDRLRQTVADIPEAQISFMTMATVPGMGTVSYVSPLVLSIADNDPVRLAREARRLKDILKRSPLADDVTCGYNTDSPHLRIHVDRAKCELMKVPLATLFSTLQHYLGSVYVNDINLGTQVNRVTVMSDWKGRSAPETMAGLYVRATTGAMVPLSALVEYEEELGPDAVYRYNRYLYCTVDMAQKPGVSLKDAMMEISRVFDRELPRDYGTGWSGIAYEESANRGSFELAVVLSLLSAFLVLMIRFESWRRAMCVLLPTVVAVFGGILAVDLAGTSLSIYSQFGLILMVVLLAAFSLFGSEGESWWRRARFPLLAAAMALPLLFITGASAEGSCSFGMTLFGGYLLFAAVGLPVKIIINRE